MDELLARFINILGTALYIALLARVLLNWLNVGQHSPLYPVVSVIYQVTEPILSPIRRVLPRFGMFDFSPIVAFLLLSLIQSVLIEALSS